MNDVYARTTANRLRFADVVDSLRPEQYAEPTLCDGWSVHELAAHMVQPFVIGFWGFFREALRHRGDTGATVDAIARRTARRHSVPDLTALLRAHAGRRLDPPRVGPLGPFVDQCVHLRDLARPLGLTADVPLADWRTCLDYLTGSAAAPALVPRGRLDGLALRATDQEWSRGAGAEVSGTSEALAMAVTGRRAALGDLAGPGRDVLGARI